MTAEPKLPPTPLLTTGTDGVYAWGLQCFEAGRQQGMAQERERQDEENLRKAISDATQRLT